jgi:hypothetical protein
MGNPSICYDYTEIEVIIASELRRHNTHVPESARFAENRVESLARIIADIIRELKYCSGEFEIAIRDTLLIISSKKVTVAVPSEVFFSGIADVVQNVIMFYDGVDARERRLRERADASSDELARLKFDWDWIRKTAVCFDRNLREYFPGIGISAITTAPIPSRNVCP